jgi:hypothetical protein
MEVSGLIASLFTGVSFTIEYICQLDIKGILGLTEIKPGSEAESVDITSSGKNGIKIVSHYR